MRGKGNKGITLIALVITIIVLLILVGVAIATLTGENGILTRTNQAKKETTDATAEEKVKIAVLGSYGKDGKISYEELQNNLDEVEGIDKQTIPSSITAESFPLTITVDEIQVEITAEGEVSLLGNLSDWDKTATPEDCFQWGSNTKGEEGYDVIIGYTEKLESYSKVRIPSRCKKIICDGTYYSVNNASNEQIGRAFFSNVEKVELPSTVVEIGPYAFGYSYGVTSSLQEIIIPDSVTSIGSCAFYNCTSLSTITIPNSVTSIGNSAFYNCSNLSSITIPDSSVSIGSGAFNNTAWYNSQADGLVYIGEGIYKYKGAMPENTSIEIKEGTKMIAGEAFRNCNNLTSIAIPDSVTNIGSDAFLFCGNLKNIIIWKSVENLGDRTFGFWENDQTINIEANQVPSGWDANWNDYCNAKIVYGYTGE